MKNSKKILSAVLVVILVLGALVFVACGPAKENLLKTMAPDDLLKYVYMTDAEEFAGKFTEAYEKIAEKQKQNQSISASIVYEPSDELIGMVEDDVLGGIKLGLNSIELNYPVTNLSENNVQMLANIGINGTEIFDVGYYTTKDGIVYSSDVLFGGAYKMPVDIAETSVDLSFIPSTDVLTSLLTKAVEIAISEVRGVTVVEGQAVKLAEVSENAVALDAPIKASTVKKIATALAEEFKTNPDIKTMIIKLYNANPSHLAFSDLEVNSAEEFYDFVISELDNALASEEGNTEAEDEVIFTLRTWIDEDYHIIGVNVFNDDIDVLIGSTENGGSTGYVLDIGYEKKSVFAFIGNIIESDNKTAIDFSISSEGNKIIALSGFNTKIDDKTTEFDYKLYFNGTVSSSSDLVTIPEISTGVETAISFKGTSVNENGKLSGSINISADGEDYIKLSFSEVDEKKMSEENIFRGNVSIETIGTLNDLLAENSLEPISMSITVNATDSNDKMDAVISVKHGDMGLGKITMTAEIIKDPAPVTVPDAEDYDTFVPEVDFDTIISRLKEAGINPTLITILEMYIEYSVPSDDYYDDYYDDEYVYGEDYYDDIFTDM